MHLLLRNGISIQLDDNEAEIITQHLLDDTGKYIQIKGRMVRTVDITGIFYEDDLDNMKAAKVGKYVCRYGNSHPFGNACFCFENPASKKKELESERNKLLPDLNDRIIRT